MARPSRPSWTWSRTAASLTCPLPPGWVSPGLNAALEGILGGSHRKADCLTDVRCPALTCYASGSGFTLPQLTAAWQLAEDIMAVRNYVNLPANLLTPMDFAARLTALAQGLPIETAVYDRQQLEDLGLRGLLTVGGSSGHPPALVVLRYTGAPEDPRRVGFVGKGVTVDSGGYCLKSASSMAGIKGDMARGRGGCRRPARSGPARSPGQRHGGDPHL